VILSKIGIDLCAWMLSRYCIYMVFGFQLQCCGVNDYKDYNRYITNTSRRFWHGRNPDALATLSCCLQNNDDNVYPPTIDNFSPSCIYNGTVATDYYQEVGLWRGVPSPVGRVWGGTAPPQKMFLFSVCQWCVWGHFGTRFGH